MSDLTRYTEDRAGRDLTFAEGLESGYAAFKIEVLLRQAGEEKLASRLVTKESAIS